VKAGWRVVPLGEVIELISGEHIDAKDYNTSGRGIGYLTGPSDFGVESPIISKWTESPKRFAEPGDILLTVKGSGVGKINRLRQERVAISRQIMAVRPKGVDPAFLFLLMASLSDHFAAQATGAAIPGISREHVTDLNVRLPPLDEQKRIVAVLDEAFEGLSRARANAEANREDARQIYASALEATFSNNSEAILTQLGNLIDISHGFAFDGSDFEPSNDQSKPIVLTPGNYSEDGALVFSDRNTKRLKVDTPKQYLFQRGDLTVVMTDLSSKMKILGKPAFISEDNLLHNQRIGRVLPKRHDCPMGYLYHFLNSDEARRRIMETATGTMVRHTAPKRILDLQVPMPRDSKEVQEATDRLDHCQIEAVQLTKRYSARIAQIDTLRQSLLRKAFSGELT